MNKKLEKVLINVISPIFIIAISVLCLAFVVWVIGLLILGIQSVWGIVFNLAVIRLWIV